MHFEDRHGKKEPFVSTWFISDVTRKQLRYEEETLAKDGHFLLNFSLRFYNIVAFLTLIVSCFFLWRSAEKWSVMLSTGMILIAGLWLGLSFLIVRSVSGLLKKTVSKHASAIKNLNLLRIVKLKYVLAQLKPRVSSISQLPDVFMKRIRDQGYGNLFSDRHWNYRVKTNLIYDLMDPKLVLGKALQTAVEKANQMGTTLWFSEELPGSTPAMLDALITTGKATMCHNLIEYIQEIKKRGTVSAEILADLELVKKQCLEDWAEMNGQ
jgi:uncharacterized membrane protein